MRKADLCRHMVRHFQGRLSRADAREFLAELERVAQRELRERGAFRIPKLAKLQIAWREPRKGRHPVTGEPMMIPGQRILRAKPSDKLKELVLAACLMVTPLVAAPASAQVASIDAGVGTTKGAASVFFGATLYAGRAGLYLAGNAIDDETPIGQAGLSYTLTRPRAFVRPAFRVGVGWSKLTYGLAVAVGRRTGGIASVDWGRKHGRGFAILHVGLQYHWGRD